MRNKLGFSLLGLLVVILIIGIFVGIAFPQYKRAVKKTITTEDEIVDANIQAKELIPLIKKWIEAKENWCKSHETTCKSSKGNCFCYDCVEIDANWPNDWEQEEITLFSRTKSPCGKSLDCVKNRWFCSAAYSTVYCKYRGSIIIGAINESLNYPLGNRISCVAYPQNEEANNFCKKLSEQNHISFKPEELKNAYNNSLVYETFGPICDKKDKRCRQEREQDPRTAKIGELNYYPLE